ncbi:YhcN/YlaJ family sporulation lipoprotein [Camelliibacillus cellulosilyticus]|uniref:YhcN/YlaJ family sporulation lipoprotein n=1 Tax=Camelliibacillus cellulosilyticus TaxID=2174486 RepID=A0ABV9GLM3_9BACL
MKKTLLTLTTGLMAAGLLTGCGTANNNDGTRTGMKNVGYYTNHGTPRYRNPVNNNYNAANYPTENVRENINKQRVNNKTIAYDTELSRRIASHVTRLSGVKDASVLVNGNTVIVGVTPKANVRNTQTLDEQVRTVAKGFARDKQIRVVTDRNIVRRIANVNARMDNGTAGTREIRSDIQGIINDIANAAKRPFQNNAR